MLGIKVGVWSYLNEASILELLQMTDFLARPAFCLSLILFGNDSFNEDQAFKRSIFTNCM